MSSPHEYEEVMRAAMRYGTDKTVDEVVAEQEARRETQRMESKMKRPAAAAGTTPRARTGQAIPKGAMDELNALLAKVPKPGVTSPPDE